MATIVRPGCGVAATLLTLATMGSLQRTLDRAQFITKRKLVHLARRIARQFINHIKRLRPLIACEAIRKELIKTLKTGFGFVRERNDCRHPLAPFGQNRDKVRVTLFNSQNGQRFDDGLRWRWR